ncbi:hypothetical protein NGRA_1383 [Nosema granulosis]|uniref:Lipoprotein n=1 Tax=Nosema granulosis TaxID=83296 RepID=A0A9P6GYI2_9MICR|nr:hypothetical protein NGRA_1383 [Nosema granulosis]
MLVLLYLVSMLASFLTCEKELLGFYKENFTKRYKALKFTDDYDLLSLEIMGIKKGVNVCMLREAKLLFREDDIFIYGLVDKENLDKINSFINQNIDDDATRLLLRSFNDRPVFYYDDPLKVSVIYSLKKQVSSKTNNVVAFDFYKGTTELNTTYLKKMLKNTICYAIGSLKV